MNLRQLTESGMWGRTWLFHLLLFFVAYVLFLAQYWLSGTHAKWFERSGLINEVAPVSLRGQAANSSAMPVREAARTVQGAGVASNGGNVSVAVSSNVEESISVEAAVAEHQQREKLDALVADANSDDTKIRTAAILRLGAAPARQSLPALQTVLISDQLAKNRQFAILSLRKLAKQQGDDSGAIRAVLQQAMSDSDPAVAKSARLAYEALAQGAQ